MTQLSGAPEELSIAELTAIVREQQVKIEALEAERTAVDTALAVERDEPASSRRGLLKLAGAAAAGAAAAATGPVGRVAATDGATVHLNASNASTIRTKIVATGGPLPIDYILGAADFDNAANFSAALGGTANGSRAANGVHGRVVNGAADDVRSGHAMIAERSGSARSNLFLVPAGGDPNDDTMSHGAGEIRMDTAGALWACVAAGTPGTWQKVVSNHAPSTEELLQVVEILLFIASAVPATVVGEPFRVYDSRLNMGAIPTGRLTVGADRIIPMRDSRDVVTGIIDEEDAVPVEAVGLIFTISMIAPTGAGFLTVNPGNSAEITSSTINFDSTSPTVQVNTSSVSLSGDRELRVIAGGALGSSCDFTIDVIGIYFDLTDFITESLASVSGPSAAALSRAPARTGRPGSLEAFRDLIAARS